MPAIIAALIAALGPILAAALQKWLSQLFGEVSSKVTETGDTAKDATALVGAAFDATPRRHLLRRQFLRHLAPIAGDTVVHGLDPEKVPALAAIAEAMPESASAA